MRSACDCHTPAKNSCDHECVRNQKKKELIEMEGIQYGIQQGYNPMTAYGSQQHGSQFGQPQLGQPGFGGFGDPLSGLIGSGMPGLFSAQNFGRQPGHVTDGVGGMFQAYGNQFGNLDPMSAAHLQQAQLAQQVQLAQLAQQ